MLKRSRPVACDESFSAKAALTAKNAVSVLFTQIAGPYEDKIAHM